MAGYHRCEHCKEWHDCSLPSKPDTGGCLGPIMVLAFIVLLSPLFLVVAEGWVNVTCEQWPNWARACERNIMFYNNAELNKRVKLLEEKVTPSPVPTPEGEAP